MEVGLLFLDKYYYSSTPLHLSIRVTYCKLQNDKMYLKHSLSIYTQL